MTLNWKLVLWGYIPLMSSALVTISDEVNGDKGCVVACLVTPPDGAEVICSVDI